MFKSKKVLSVVLLILFIFCVMLIAVSAVMLIQFSRMRSEANSLTEQLSALESVNKTLISQIETQKTEIEELSSENAALAAELYECREGLKETWIQAREEIRHVLPNLFTLSIDQRLEPELVDLIIRHLSALSDGDEGAYRATLRYPDAEHLLGFFENRGLHLEGAPAAIYTTESAGDDALTNGPLFIFVSLMQQGSVYRYEPAIGVTKIDGNWVIYDYD